jgi:hypothetical protein
MTWQVCQIHFGSGSFAPSWFKESLGLGTSLGVLGGWYFPLGVLGNCYLKREVPRGTSRGRSLDYVIIATTTHAKPSYIKIHWRASWVASATHWTTARKGITCTCIAMSSWENMALLVATSVSAFRTVLFLSFTIFVLVNVICGHDWSLSLKWSQKVTQISAYIKVLIKTGINSYKNEIVFSMYVSEIMIIFIHIWMF